MNTNTDYTVKQFKDEGLAHFSYAIVSEGQIALVDPARNPEPYYQFAKEQGAQITAVIETHPHADFVSSHKEISETGATTYVSKLVGADYPHISFDDGDTIALGAVILAALNTPGHSPDSISVLLEVRGLTRAIFSGDTLFVGDVGRPDLRESAGNITAQRVELAGMMFDTVQKKLKILSDDVVVYPAHGAGTLCGKALGAAPTSTIGEERKNNPAFQETSREAFIARLTDGQPYIPAYFAYDVAVNKHGAPDYAKGVSNIKTVTEIPTGALIIDTRTHERFNAGHLGGAINIAFGNTFETWLGTIVNPEEMFYLVVADEGAGREIIGRAAKIGYESFIAGMYIGDIGEARSAPFPIDDFTAHPEQYTIVDVRAPHETIKWKPFAHSLSIPINELRRRIKDIPNDLPVVVHCAGGYRSAIAYSLLEPTHSVHDLGERIKVYSAQGL